MDIHKKKLPEVFAQMFKAEENRKDLQTHESADDSHASSRRKTLLISKPVNTTLRKNQKNTNWKTG